MFAVAKDIASPDEDQEARAKRVADAIRMGEQPPEMRWQDNEAIHQDVLEREILLQDDLDPFIIEIANQRWIELANQSMQKQGGMPPGGPDMGGGGMPPGMPGASAPGAIPPDQMPLAGGNPPMGSVDMVTEAMRGTPDAEVAARQADAMTMQM
jgi:hypothetical protein